MHECLRKHTAQLSEGCRKEELHLVVMQAQVGIWQSWFRHALNCGSEQRVQGAEPSLITDEIWAVCSLPICCAHCSSNLSCKPTSR